MRVMPMSLFDWLLIAHLIGDFLFQSESMAMRKTHHWSWMLAHVGVYAGVMAVVLVVFTLTHAIPVWLVVVALLFLGATHALLDRRVLTIRWMRWKGTSSDHPWLPIVVDQVFHLVALAVVAQVLSAVGS